MLPASGSVGSRPVQPCQYVITFCFLFLLNRGDDLLLLARVAHGRNELDLHRDFVIFPFLVVFGLATRLRAQMGHVGGVALQCAIGIVVV